MKKTVALTLAAALSAAALSVTALAAGSMTAAQAEDLAAQYVPEGSEKTWTEYDDGRYEVNFYNSTLQESYEVKVNPATGKVTDFDSSLLDHRGSRTVTLTEEQAGAAVTGELADAEVLSTVLDRDDGYQTYEVRFSADGFYGEYTIHPETGAILERDVKVGTLPGSASSSTASASALGAAASSSSSPSSGYIGTEKAESIALEKAPGATVVKCKLDREDGRMVYEVEARDGWLEYEFEIDAATGSILKYDAEYDD